MSKGILTVVSGFSGAGKSTITKAMVKDDPEYCLSISATTRAKRKGETEGKEYFFLSHEQFDAMVENNMFLEHASYAGNDYGTPAAYVDEQLRKGKNVILEIDVQGGILVKTMRPDTVLVFLTAPTVDIIKERLIGRGTETEDVIKTRLDEMARESTVIPSYDYLVVNDVLEDTINTVKNIIQAERLKISAQKEAVEEIIKQAGGKL